MKAWKVILATCVIFGCGVLTGAILVGWPSERLARGERAPKPGAPQFQRFEFLRKATKDMDLTPDQQARVAKILSDSQERTKQIMDHVAPQMRDEMHRVREAIRAELTPEQQKTFEALLKVRPPKKGEDLPGEDKHRHPPKSDFFPAPTNAPNSQLPTNSAGNPDPAH